jgi:hypothetical protein
MLRLEKVYLERWVTGTRKDERYGRYTAVLIAVEAATKPRDALGSVTAISNRYEKRVELTTSMALVRRSTC